MQVDKGYDNLRGYAARRGIDVDMPVKKRRKQKNEETNKQMARESVRRSRGTARTRIHVEREMIRIKNYRLFEQMIPLEYKDILDDLIWIAVCLGNYVCSVMFLNISCQNDHFAKTGSGQTSRKTQNKTVSCRYVPMFSIFHVETVILPRQARDEHKETHNKIISVPCREWA